MEGDNICCNLRVKPKNESTVNISGCIEINKYEIERFKYSLSEHNFNNMKNEYIDIGILECASEINKINILLILIIYFIIN